MRNQTIPTESFFIANERIMATICGGQLTTDHNMGLSALHAPVKDAPTLIQSTRTRLMVNGQWTEPLDDDKTGTLLRRGYAGDSLAVEIAWQAGPLEVTDVWFIPPDTDVVVQRIHVCNRGDEPCVVKLFGLLYPQLGSPVPHKKGICKEGRYDEAGCLLIQDLKQSVLVFGFDKSPTEYQLGEVCATTDVYYDLEDGALSGNRAIKGVTPNAALALDLGVLAPGEECFRELFLAHTDEMDAGRDLYLDLLARRAGFWPAHLEYCRSVIAHAAPLRAVGDWDGERMEALWKRCVLVLRSILRTDGAPMGGIHCYQNVGQVRNGSYILSVLDRLGFHEETRGGYEFYLKFRVGDARFSSPDENDQLGTVLHVLRLRMNECDDLAMIEQNREAIFAMAGRLLGLVDPQCGLIYSERAIHEFVAISRGYETYVNTMAVRGLLDAAHLAGRLGCPQQQEHFTRGGECLRASMMKQLVDPELGVFVKRRHLGRPDPLPAISALTPALFGVIDPCHEIVTRTIEHLKRHIWDPKLGGLWRYPLPLQPWPEHPYGGPWVTYTSWLARVHLMRGERKQAADIIRWVLDNVPEDSNLIPEHFSTAHAGRRGFHRIYLEPATPEIWAVAEFIRLVLDFQQEAV